MAGTRVIANSYLDPTVPVDGADVYAAVADSATNNACTDPCAWEGTYVKPVSVGVTTDLGPVVNGGAIPTGAQGVRVSTDRHPSTFFMKVVGIATLDVGASATALTSQLEPPPAGILLPIGVFDADYQVGTNYTLTEGAGRQLGWMSWFGSPRNPTLDSSLCFPITSVPSRPGSLARPA